MNHTIEPAKTGRSKCRTCKLGIPKGTLRLAEAFGSQYSKDVAARFHHLKCAADARPLILRQALGAYQLELPERDELERLITRALSAADVAQESTDTGHEYRKFVDAMIADPGNDDAVLVFADWLQSVGDPRGELIVVQSAKETASTERLEQLKLREQELLRAHRKQFVPEFLRGAVTWHRGFVSGLKLTERTSVTPESLADLWTHPSMLLVRELGIEIPEISSRKFVLAANLPALPASLVSLELDVGVDVPLGAVSEVIASAPNLATLRINGVADVENLAHPALSAVELTTDDASLKRKHEPMTGAARRLSDRVGKLTRKHLPALTRLAITASHGLDAVCRALASSDLRDQVRSLALSGDMTRTGAKALAKGLDNRVLATLDVSQCDGIGAPEFDLLRPCCDELVTGERVTPRSAPASDVGLGDWLVRHTRKPEWGVGRVVDEHEDRLEVEFENAGHKVIRGVELLEDV